MSLQDILNTKGSKVLSIDPQATLADVVQKLVKNNCGSLVVCEQEDCARMVGIITERDILRACADRKASLEQQRSARRDVGRFGHLHAARQRARRNGSDDQPPLAPPANCGWRRPPGRHCFDRRPREASAR